MPEPEEAPMMSPAGELEEPQGFESSEAGGSGDAQVPAEAVNQGDTAASISGEWEPNPDRANYMADAAKDHLIAARMAEKEGLTERAEKAQQEADARAQEGAAEYDRGQERQREEALHEIRLKESRRLYALDRERRFEEEVRGHLDKIFEAVNLPPGQPTDLLDVTAGRDWDEKIIDSLYRRLQLERPGVGAEADFTHEESRPDTTLIIGGRQADQFESFRTQTEFGVVIIETRYKPSHQYRESDRVRLMAEKVPAESVA